MLAGLAVVLAVVLLLLFGARRVETPSFTSQRFTVSSPTSEPRAGTAGSLEAKTTSAEPTPAERAPNQENAADLYKNAFVLIDALSDDEKAALRDHRRAPAELQTDKAAALFAKIQPILELLRRARAEGLTCDWGLTFERTDAPMPHLQPVMNLAQLTRWAAAYEFPSDPQAALGDLAAGLEVAHSVADHVMIGFLVSTASDRSALEVIRDNYSAFSADVAEQALALVASADSASQWSAALLHEADGMHGSLALFDDPKAYAQLRAAWIEGALADAPALQAMSAAEMKAHFGSLEQIARGYAERWGQPGFDSWWSAVQTDAAGKPLVSEALKAFDTAAQSVIYTGVQRAMAATALSILTSGPDALASVRDPATGGQFVYVPLENGFELRSSFAYKGQPAKMQFTWPGP
jgi:hypothetical protein